MADPNFFQNRGPFPLAALADIGAAALEDESQAEKQIADVAALDTAGAGDITFLANPKYKNAVKTTKAAACIVSADFSSELARNGLAILRANDPYKSYALIAQAFYPVFEGDAVQIHPKAVIDGTAKIGKGTEIGANTVIGPHVRIGSNCYIGPNVTISHAHIGNSCRIFPGVAIGQDGFGFAMDFADRHVTVPQLGRVIIEDYVEIGANSTIDRGAGPDTVIGEGTRIDNLVQIGHNVKIGKNCVIVAQSGVSGSTVIEDYVVLAAQSGIAGHITIGQGAQIGAKTGVPSDIEAGAKMMGYPAKPMRDFWQEQALLKKMLTDRKAKLNKKG